MNNIKSYLFEEIENIKVQYDNLETHPSMRANHFHDEYEIYYLMSGERNYFVDNKVYNIKKGDIVLINHNVIHRTISVNSSKYERACFYFNDNFLKSFPQYINSIDISSCFKENVNIMRLDYSQQLFMDQLVKKMNNECTLKSDLNKAYVQILMIELLIFIQRCIKTQRLINNTANLDTKQKKILEIITYINNHYMDELSLSLLSNKFYVSISYLTKNFRLVTGFSFIEYLNNLRIKEAINLLQQTNLSISTISQKVGYTNISHFGRIFKSIAGCSAIKYRKLYKNQKV